MNELTMTVSGWAATDPSLRIGAGGTTMATFRVASTARYFDRDKREWVDGKTEWFTVRVFRGAAITVKESILKGQPVVITGRLRTNEWESQSGPRTDLVIDATAVGHDLTRGIARFSRATGDTALDPTAAAPATDSARAEGDGPRDGEHPHAESSEEPGVEDTYAPLDPQDEVPGAEDPQEGTYLDEEEVDVVAAR